MPSSTPGDLPDPGFEPVSLAGLVSPALAGKFFSTAPLGRGNSNCKDGMSLAETGTGEVGDSAA